MIKRICLVIVLLGNCLLSKSEGFMITKFGAINDSTVLNNVTAKSPGLNNNYEEVTTDSVFVNGIAFVLKNKS